jgi:hypothetical protein
VGGVVGAGQVGSLGADGLSAGEALVVEASALGGGGVEALLDLAEAGGVLGLDLGSRRVGEA